MFNPLSDYILSTVNKLELKFINFNESSYKLWLLVIRLTQTVKCFVSKLTTRFR